MSKKIGFIGGGNMGAAIMAGICHDYMVFVCEQDKKKAQTLKRKYRVILTDLATTIDKAGVIILAVKPQQFEGVLDEMRRHTTTEKLIISIAAGVKSSYIQKKVGPKTRVVRVMPNLPVQAKEGASGIALGKYATRNDLIIATRIFNRIGKSVVVDESHLDAVTAVSGSGPAYVFQFVEQLTKAARRLGLKPNIANELVVQTLKGSVTLLEKSKEDASTLRKRVTSKGGTTEAALNVLNKKGTEKIYCDALGAAKKRAKELSKG